MFWIILASIFKLCQEFGVSGAFENLPESLKSQKLLHFLSGWFATIRKEILEWLGSIRFFDKSNFPALFSRPAFLHSILHEEKRGKFYFNHVRF